MSPQNILGRIGGLLSILSYTECSYIHLLIYIRFVSGAVKIVREHSMAPAGRFGGGGAYKRNRELTTGTALARSLPVVVDKVYEHHTGKALNSAANL